MPRPAQQLKPLTKRESAITCALARGLTRYEIAENLGCSVKTVDSHRLNILAKLRLEGTVALCRYAIEHSLIPIPGTDRFLRDLPPFED